MLKQLLASMSKGFRVSFKVRVRGLGLRLRLSGYLLEKMPEGFGDRVRV